MTFNKEQKEYEAYISDIDVPPIDDEQMELLMDNPPMQCEVKQDCESFQNYGDKCRCIRSVFKHYTHYEHYQTRLKNEIEQAFAEIVFKDR